MSSEQQEILPEEFLATIGTAEQGKVVSVKLGADWCGPCKSYDQAVGSLIAEFGDRVEFVCINSDLITNRSTKHTRAVKKGMGGEINFIPLTGIFKGGELCETVTGVHMGELRRKIETVLGDV